MTIIDKIKNLLRQKQQEIPPMPLWEEIVKIMYDKNLDAFADEVVKVVYSKDKTMRYVLLKDKKGLFTYQLEAICPFDEDEWKYIFSQDNALPAAWELFYGTAGKSFFANEEECLKEMRTEPEYKSYFC